MNKPIVDCPACVTVRQRVTDGEYTVICAIVLEELLEGKSRYENFEIVPLHCQEYTKCGVWREDKEKDWMRKAQKYSSLDQMEKIRV